MKTNVDRHPIKRLLLICKARLRLWLLSVLGWLFVLYISATMLLKYDTDTTDISGAIFVVVAILAGLAFTYAGVLPDDGRDRADVIYAGERLCQGAMIVLAASLLKYGTIVIPTQFAALSTWIDAHPGGGRELDPLVLVLQVTQFLIFVSGVYVAQLGYKTLGRVVALRTSRKGSEEHS